MTIGDFLDKHFVALYILALLYISGRFITVTLMAWLKKSLDEKEG